MKYTIGFKPRSLKDIDSIPSQLRGRIIGQIERLENGLAGDVKRLTNFTPEYRLRVGDYRVLFEIDGQNIIIYRVIHRKDAYR